MKKIIILGNGGHAKSIADAIESEGKYEIVGYISNDSSGNNKDYPIIGTDDDLFDIYQMGIRTAVIGIGYMGKGDLRKVLYNRLKKIGYHLPVICDSTAIVSNKATIEEGCFIGKRAVINTNVHLGSMSIINTGAIIEHDCKIGAYSHISVGTVLCGNVIIGEETFVGANATIIQNVEIASKCIIGAGEVVKSDILEKKSIISCGRSTYKTNLKFWRL